jgi:hypothetical protein
MSNAVLIALVVALGVGFVVALFAFISAMFRRHDPKRSRASVALAPDGSFALAIPHGRTGGNIFFRFEISGTDTDGNYAIAVHAELTRGGSIVSTVERHTASGMTPIGPGRVSRSHSINAATLSMGSFELLSLPSSGDFVVKGRARAEAPTELVKAWAYLVE